jgi:hypothetical protein
MLEGGQRSWKFAVPPAAIGFVAGNARLRDRVADNAAKNDITEREPPDREGLRGPHRHRDRPERKPVRGSLTKGAISRVFRR